MSYDLVVDVILSECKVSYIPDGPSDLSLDDVSISVVSLRNGHLTDTSVILPRVFDSSVIVTRHGWTFSASVTIL